MTTARKQKQIIGNFAKTISLTLNQTTSTSHGQAGECCVWSDGKIQEDEMATQGLVTITHGDIVTHKIIAGCNWYEADNLINAINSTETITIGKLVELAKSVSFGCDECLVVMDMHSSVSFDDELPERYRRTFNDKKFNPRWERGTADYIRVIDR